jgi:hypothetical protein
VACCDPAWRQRACRGGARPVAAALKPPQAAAAPQRRLNRRNARRSAVHPRTRGAQRATPSLLPPGCADGGAVQPVRPGAQRARLRCAQRGSDLDQAGLVEAGG